MAKPGLDSTPQNPRPSHALRALVDTLADGVLVFSRTVKEVPTDVLAGNSFRPLCKCFLLPFLIFYNHKLTEKLYIHFTEPFSLHHLRVTC